MVAQVISVGLNESGNAASKTTRLQPPGGAVHLSHDLVPNTAETKASSRVIRPPGGISTIFADLPENQTCSGDITPDDSNSVSSASPPPPTNSNERTKLTAMEKKLRSNFVLGDQQLTMEEQMRQLALSKERQMNNRRRSGPKGMSINPITGQAIGVFKMNGETEERCVDDHCGDSTGSQADLTDSASVVSSCSSASSTGSASGGVVPQPLMNGLSRDTVNKNVKSPASANSTPKRNRVPPGGYSSPLW